MTLNFTLEKSITIRIENFPDVKAKFKMTNDVLFVFEKIGQSIEQMSCNQYAIRLDTTAQRNENLTIVTFLRFYILINLILPFMYFKLEILFSVHVVFAETATYEGYAALKLNMSVQLSVQQILDCSNERFNCLSTPVLPAKTLLESESDYKV